MAATLCSETELAGCSLVRTKHFYLESNPFVQANETFFKQKTMTRFMFFLKQLQVLWPQRRNLEDYRN